MWKRIVIPFLILLLPATPAHTNEFAVGLGVMTLEGGTDFHVSYRLDQSHWQFGYRHIQWTDRWEWDPSKTESTTTMTGPIVCYLFDIESSKTFYFGVSQLRWSNKLKSHMPDESDTDSVTAPFFGGGHIWRVGKLAYYKIGLFTSGATLKTETSVSSEETDGLDLQLQMGIVF